ncbi:MAG: hypothetical protein WBQ09_13890 [Terriglobales bacterium]
MTVLLQTPAPSLMCAEGRAQIMANAAIVQEKAGSTIQLKKVIEQSLAILGENNDTPRPVICLRSLPLYVNPANRQKVALLSAAKALASLWEVSKPKPARRPPSELFLQLRCTNGA